MKTKFTILDNVLSHKKKKSLKTIMKQKSDFSFTEQFLNNFKKFVMKIV